MRSRIRLEIQPLVRLLIPATQCGGDTLSNLLLFPFAWELIVNDCGTMTGTDCRVRAFLFVPEFERVTVFVFVCRVRKKKCWNRL